MRLTPSHRRVSPIARAALALAALALARPDSAAGQGACTLYVRSGVVSGDGKTPATAFATIGEAAAAVRNPGDVVCVGAGTYREGNIAPQKDGVDGFPVVFRADAGRVEIAPPAGGFPEVTTAFLLNGTSHVAIEGFFIRGFADAGIQVKRGPAGQLATDIAARRNTVAGGAKIGIDISAVGRVVVEANVVSGNGTTGISILSCDPEPEPPPGEGTSRCAAGVANQVIPIVANNRVGGNGAFGLFLEATQSALVQNNVVFSNGAAGIGLRTAPDSRVVNNLVYDNTTVGISIGKADRAAPDTLVANNTLYANGDWGVEIGSANAPSPGALVVNNIFQGNAGRAKGLGVLANSTCAYVAGFNLVADEYGAETPFNAYDAIGLAGFGDADGADDILGFDGAVDGGADDDFTFGAASPARDAGSAGIASIGLTGSTDPSGRPDAGRVDIGFHYAAASAQSISIDEPFMPIFVSTDGSDLDDGKLPERSMATLAAAALEAVAGVSVVATPGQYAACDVGPPPEAGKASFVADADGRRSGRDPGVVLVDAGGCEAAFALPRSCFITVEGFHVRGGIDAGILVDSGAQRAEIRHNVAFANRRGIQVANADDTFIWNNLCFGNAGGIQIGGKCAAGEECPDAGSRRAVLMNNTCYGNEFDGILIGAGVGTSSHASVLFNIMAGNGKEGIEVGSDLNPEAHLEGFTAHFNVNTDGYGSLVRPPSDLVLDLAADPLFVDPRAIAVDGDWAADDSFRLSHTDAGQTATSRAVDYSNTDAALAGFAQLSTRSDGAADAGLLDPGYHYPIRQTDQPVVGDCNGDGSVAIDELIRGVRIALGEAPVATCAAFDRDGDGRVGIAELVAAVGEALAQTGAAR